MTQSRGSRPCEEIAREFLSKRDLEGLASRISSEQERKWVVEALEKACVFRDASEAAFAFGWWERSVINASFAGEIALLRRVIGALSAEPDRLRKLGESLRSRRNFGFAAELFQACGANEEAVAAFLLDGNVGEAAALLLGEPVRAIAMLEEGLRKEPARNDWRILLARIFLEVAKVENAARVLQKIPMNAPEARARCTLLGECFDALGLDHAVRENERLLLDLGGPYVFEPLAPTSKAKEMLLSRFSVHREVASTANARVVYARDVLRGEDVAVKLFLGLAARGTGRDAKARFLREIDALRALNHPNIVRVIDALPEVPAVVLEWMPGGSLEALGQVSPKRAAEIVAALLRALGEVHRMGIVHRDIKPANVLFDGTGTPKLADFGAAHLGDLSSTATGGVFGTLGYMSPEQQRGEPATVASDLYSVGAIFRELLGIQVVDETSLPDLHQRAFLQSLLSSEKERRPRDVFAALQSLEAIVWSTALGVGERTASPISHRVASTMSRLAPIDGAQGGAGTATDERDTWLDRTIRRLPWTPLVEERAKLAIDGPAPLQQFLKIDTLRKECWLEVPPRLDETGSLCAWSKEDIERAEEAIRFVHAKGGTLGAVDDDHCFPTAFGPVVLLSDGHADLSLEAKQSSGFFEEKRRSSGVPLGPGLD